MKPIRVLHVVTKMDANGLETLIMNWYRNINREKVQFDFLVHREEEGFYDKEISKLGGRIYSVPPINPLHHKKYLNSLSLFFETHKEYQIVHSHLNTYSMWPLRAAEEAGVLIRIAHSHIANVPLDHKTVFRMYTKTKLTNFTTTNFACSTLAGKWLFGEKNQFKVINNAIDSRKYAFNLEVRHKLRAELKVEDRFVIGHIGRFTKQKNHKFILEIFHEILKSEPEAILVLVGEGGLKSEVIKMSKILGINDSIIFTGVRNDVPDLLQAMDVFLFPSIYEGLGIVAVEAQAAGLPTIVSEEVPGEAYITNLIKRVNLSESINSWADTILQYSTGFIRHDTSNEIIANNFDIKATTKWLEEFYTNAI